MVARFDLEPSEGLLRANEFCTRCVALGADMTLHVPALPAWVEPDAADAADAAAQEQAARRRKRIETAITVTATIAVVIVISVANVAFELGR